MKGRLGRVLRSVAWALALGAGLYLFVAPLDALGAVLVLPPLYHTGLRLLLGALWLVGVVAIALHDRPDQGP